MSVITPKFQLGLTHNLDTLSFSVDKYIDLAGLNPAGRRTLQLVETNWIEWANKVEQAPWLRNWVHSPLYSCGGDTPTGSSVPAYLKRSAVALAVFGSAVWGFGVEGWLRGEPGSWSKQAVRKPLNKLHKLQGVSCPNAARTYTWDEDLQIGCGILVPCEYALLDRWLEPLYQEALEQSTRK